MFLFLQENSWPSDTFIIKSGLSLSCGHHCLGLNANVGERVRCSRPQSEHRRQSHPYWLQMNSQHSSSNPCRPTWPHTSSPLLPFFLSFKPSFPPLSSFLPAHFGSRFFPFFPSSLALCPWFENWLLFSHQSLIICELNFKQGLRS